MPAGDVAPGLSQNRYVVLNTSNASITDVTEAYRRNRLLGIVPHRVDLGHPPVGELLGPTWYPSEGDFRWMPQEATVKIGLPEGRVGQILVDTICVPMLLKDGPIVLSIALNDVPANATFQQLAKVIFGSQVIFHISRNFVLLHKRFSPRASAHER